MGASTGNIEYRPATHDDYEAVVEFTDETWADLAVEVSDYLPDVYHDWIDGDNRQTIVADAGDDIAGIAQVVALSSWEGWAQGMRVNPAFRGEGIGRAINDHLFRWAREQELTVVRNMVFSWNQAGLGQSRALGYEPTTEFRWLHRDPDADAVADLDSYRGEADAAWAYWTTSDARDHLRGLALDTDESWALRELTRETLARAAAEQRLLTVGEETTRGFAYLSRTEDNAGEDGEQRLVEYGVAAWADLAAGRQLLDAVAADAATRDADTVRLLVPETPRFVSDGAHLRAGIGQNPDFVLSASIGEAE